MKVITDIKFVSMWPHVMVSVTKQELILDDAGAVVGFGIPEIETDTVFVEEISVGPQ